MSETEQPNLNLGLEVGLFPPRNGPETSLELIEWHDADHTAGRQGTWHALTRQLCNSDEEVSKLECVVVDNSHN
jgi:hypothetical protein